MASAQLSDAQLSALLDILSHHEVYNEIRGFRYPGTLARYGPPFEIDDGQPSTSPSLQALVSSFLLPVPGLKNISPEFWRKQVGSLIEDFEKANLSESYDKGSIGIRRTLATAASAVLEYPVRGIFNGFDEPDPEATPREYRLTDADDLQAGFTDTLQQCVYGTYLDEIFAKVAESDKLSDHKSLLQAAHEFGLVNLASFLHYALILSPRGQSIITLLDNVNKLVPYAIIKQTLKIGNVASMINAMMKVVLAKVSVGSVTNWLGITQGASEGHNLLQQIISTVLHWDIRDMKSKATKIEKEKSSPSRDQLNAIKAYVPKSMDEQEAVRRQSQQESKPIVTVILAKAGQSTELTEEQHKFAQDYLATQLSIRDREQIIKVLCDAHPDNLTQAIRDLVAIFEPIIREVHKAVDLSDTCTDVERFIKDLLKLSKLSDQQKDRGRTGFSRSGPVAAPTVGDFIELLHRHQYSLHKFLHQCAKNGKDLTEWFFEYAKQTAAHFKHKTPERLGDLSEPLAAMFSSLPDDSQARLLPVLDGYNAYLAKIHAASEGRLGAVLSDASHHPSLWGGRVGTGSNSLAGSRTASPAPAVSGDTASPAVATNPVLAAKHSPGATPGPGAYLARWKQLLDSVPLTPGPKGPTVPVAADTSTTPNPELTTPTSPSSTGKPFEQREHDLHETEDAFHEARAQVEHLGLQEGERNARPDVSPVVQALGGRFRVLLAQQSCDW